jgi:hypothetical protein
MSIPPVNSPIFESPIYAGTMPDCDTWCDPTTYKRDEIPASEKPEPKNPDGSIGYCW